MKLAFSNLAWSAADDPAVAQVLVQEGATGVELAPSKVWARAPRVPDGAAEGCATWWLERGQTIVALQGILYGRPELALFGDAEPFVEHIERMGVLAARCGARVMVLGAPANRKRGERSMAAAVKVAARVLRDAAERLSPHGVALCIEPNPPRYGCDFVTTAAEAAVLADAVDHPCFGVHLDTAALALSGETTAGALEPIMRHVRHVHISEVDLAPVSMVGRVPHAAIGGALRDTGYAGWVSVEMKMDEQGRWIDAIVRAADVARTNYLG